MQTQPQIARGAFALSVDSVDVQEALSVQDNAYAESDIKRQPNHSATAAAKKTRPKVSSAKVGSLNTSSQTTNSHHY